MKTLILVLGLCLGPIVAFAQTPAPWTIALYQPNAAPDEAGAFIYRARYDSGSWMMLTGHTCATVTVATGPVTECRGTLPAPPADAKTLTVYAENTFGRTSPQTTVSIVPPDAPKGIRRIVVVTQ